MYQFGTWQGNKWLNKETFAAGQSKVYRFQADWSPAATSRKRDFSVVAWGLDSEGSVKVEYGDGANPNNV
jgi:hypothetical protein